MDIDSYSLVAFLMTVLIITLNKLHLFSWCRTKHAQNLK